MYRMSSLFPRCTRSKLASSGAPPRDECRSLRGIAVPRLAERGAHLTLLTVRESHVDGHEHWEHHERHERRPLQEEPEHDDDERHILWMAHAGVGAGRCQCALT